MPETTTAPSIAERVAAGAAYLDEHQPDWVDLIDLDRLDLASTCRCVLGQLEIALTGDSWADYHDATDRLALDDAETIRLGFECASGRPGLEYAALTAAWSQLIEARRAGAR